MGAIVSTCPVQSVLEDICRRLTRDRSGEVATYIPELAKANPEWFGACLVTADGKTYEVGETQQAFTIQSISKPFVYGEDNGQAEVLKKVWLEPSGEAFNAISLRPGQGQPDNPDQRGAIATTSLVEGDTAKKKICRILAGIGRYAGRLLSVDESVYRSECVTGDRNRAIAYMLKNFNIIESDPTPSLEAYFMQCSISVTCRDPMAATLANGGVNPITGARAVIREYVEKHLSVTADGDLGLAQGNIYRRTPFQPFALSERGPTPQALWQGRRSVFDQGAVVFISSEVVIRKIMKREKALWGVVLDFASRAGG